MDIHQQPSSLTPFLGWWHGIITINILTAFCSDLNNTHPHRGLAHVLGNISWFVRSHHQEQTSWAPITLHHVCILMCVNIVPFCVSGNQRGGGNKCPRKTFPRKWTLVVPQWHDQQTEYPKMSLESKLATTQTQTHTHLVSPSPWNGPRLIHSWTGPITWSRAATFQRDLLHHLRSTFYSICIATGKDASCHDLDHYGKPRIWPSSRSELSPSFTLHQRPLSSPFGKFKPTNSNTKIIHDLHTLIRIEITATVVGPAPAAAPSSK